MDIRGFVTILLLPMVAYCHDVGGQRLKNVGAPIDGNDAATKNYVDSADANFGLYLKIDGSNASQDIDVNGWDITAVDVNASGALYVVTSTPASSSASGRMGRIAWDSDYIYICVGNNSWKRAALSTWAITDVLLLDDGASKLLLDDGSSFLLIRP